MIMHSTEPGDLGRDVELVRGAHWWIRGAACMQPSLEYLPRPLHPRLTRTTTESRRGMQSPQLVSCNMVYIVSLEDVPPVVPC